MFLAQIFYLCSMHIETYARQTHTARHLPISCNKIKITEYSQLFNISMPFSLLDTINKCKWTSNFTAGNYLNLHPHYSYRKWHTITLDTIKELLCNIIYCTWRLFLVYEWIFLFSMQVSVKFPVVKEVCIFGYLLKILQSMVHMNQTSVVIFKTRITLSEQFQA